MLRRTTAYALLMVCVVLVVMTACPPVTNASPPAGEPVDPLSQSSSPAALNDYPYIGSETLLSWPADAQGDRFAPAVAYNSRHDEYLVVWHNAWPGGKRDIYARRVAANGRMLSYFAISTGTNDRLQADVAYNFDYDEYLVVWMYDVNGDGSVYDIWGRIVAFDGRYMEPEFQIASWPNRTFSGPRVESVVGNYLVVWNASDATTGLPTDVSSMLVGPDGGLVQGRNLVTSDYPQQADVVYGAGYYLVVFVKAFSAQTTGNDIYGLRVDQNNAVVDPPGIFAIYGGEKHQNAPRVATNHHWTYLVVWEHEHSATDHDIYGQRLDWDGSKLGGSVPLSISTADETRPDVVGHYRGFAADPDYDFLIAWQQDQSNGTAVMGRRWPNHSGPFYEFAAYDWWEAVAPALAWGYDSPCALVIWEGDSTADPLIDRHIYGCLWMPNAVFVPWVLR